MKKKILIGFMINGKAGGVDKYILSLLSVLNTDEYEVTLLTREVDEQLQRDLNAKRIMLVQLVSAKHPIRQYQDMKKLMEKEKYDVVYFNMSTAILGMGVIAAKKVRVKKRIVHSHSSGYDSESRMKRIVMTAFHDLLKRICFQSATTFVACSEKAGEWMYTPKMLNSDRYHVIHNTVCLNEFIFDSKIREEMRQKLHLGNKTMIIHVANFTYPKNHEFIISVLHEVVRKDKNYIMYLIGSGANEGHIRNQVNQLGLQNYVVFTGQVDNVTEYLQAGDVFVLPSRFEGYPISALEAQASGITCILSDRITKEAKITSKCHMLPLKRECWKELILKLTVDHDRETETLDQKMDNTNLCDCIMKLWRE